MAYEPVQEMSVVGHDDERALEFEQVLLEYVQRHDVQVVSRLVENEQVRVLHQYGKQVEPSFFAARELADLSGKHIVRKEELV